MSTHIEFSELTPQALEALRKANHCLDVSKPGWNRRYLSAFLLEAINQATDHNGNLHSPPPPPPTLAQARAADLDMPAGKAVVRDFLATLGKGGQP
jgi:hypothetical protein